MIEGHEKLRIPDLNKEKDFFLEVNWTKDKKIRECKVIKLTAPNGECSYVKRDHLHALLFAIGTPAQQMKLIPQTIQKVRELEGVFKVKAKKDIRKGEEVVFPYKIAIPEPEEIVIQDIAKKMIKGSIPSPF